RHALLVFIPKGVETCDSAELGKAVAARSPSEVRPITLANADYKLCAAALKAPLADGRGSIHPGQSCCRGRKMVDNILALEGRSIAHSLIEELPAGLLLTDFGDAFPSLCRHFLLAVLRAMG
ncbi:MAG: hypothetical protein ACKPKO_54875, partial [Candidatus Fonsibacter sp.]